MFGCLREQNQNQKMRQFLSSRRGRTMPRHILTKEEQKKGVEKALQSPRTPPQLKKGLEKRKSQLQNASGNSGTNGKSQLQSTNGNSSRNGSSRRKKNSASQKSDEADSASDEESGK
jgi:hypothetical protein